MKEVYFKQIMIADLQNKTARVQPFEKGLNVVTSIDNHVGKSSLADSIRRFQQQLNKTISDIQEDEQNIKEISKELRKLPNKKEVEEKYIEYARLNIMTLDA